MFAVYGAEQHLPQQEDLVLRGLVNNFSFNPRTINCRDREFHIYRYNARVASVDIIIVRILSISFDAIFPLRQTFDDFRSLFKFYDTK